MLRELAAYGVRAAVADEVVVWKESRPGDVVLIMSNGAFGGIYGMFRQMAGE